MNLDDVVAEALGNLRRQKLRTFLTSTGVMIGVTTTAVLMAFPAGVHNVIESYIDKQELLTTMTITGRKFQIPQTFNIEAIRKAQEDARAQKPVPLDDDVIEKLKKIPGVLTCYPDTTSFANVEVNEIAIPFQQTNGLPVDGVTPNYKKAILAGAFWSPEATEGVCVFPSALLQDYGLANASEAIGKKVYLTRFQDYSNYKTDPPRDEPLPEGKRRRFIREPSMKFRELAITGVYDSEEFGLVGSQVLMPIEQAKEVQTFSKMSFGGGAPKPGEGQYRQLTLKCSDRHVVESVRAEVGNMQLGTFIYKDLVRSLDFVFGIIEAGMGMFGGIALIVSVFGIANTMVMAVLERTREIGILKALGGRDGDVWKLFMVEAGSIGILGGVAGVIVAAISCVILNALAAHILEKPVAQVAVFQISAWLGVFLVGFAGVVAGAAGLYPAFRASKLDPVEALRRE